MIVLKRTALLFTFLLFTFPAIADENNYDRQYLSMVDQAMTMPADFNFKALRDLYTKTSFYGPYSKNPKVDISKIIDAHHEGDTQASEKLDNYYKQHFVFFSTQVWYKTAVLGQGLKGNPKIADWAVPQILDLTLDAYTGESKDDAYQVISVGEEYEIIKALRKIKRYQFKDRSLQTYEGRAYDIWNVFDPAGEKEIKLYFDVTVPLGTISGPEALI